MILDIIQDKEYLRRQIFKTPAKILLNSLTGYYFLNEARAKNYFEHVVGMILLQTPDKKAENICVDLINKYSSKLETYKSKGDQKEKISMIMFLLFIMVTLLFIGLFIIATWYKSATLIYILLLISTCVIFYFTSVYSSSNDKKAQNLENALSSLNEIVASNNLAYVSSDEDVAKTDILSILKFMSDEKYIKLKFEINSYKFNEVSDLGTIPMTNIVRILHILKEYKKVEFTEELEKKESSDKTNIKGFAEKFANHFKLNGNYIKADSFETTFNNLTYDITRCDLNKINNRYKDVLSVIFDINNKKEIVMKKPMIIGFVCQKGGVGKSTMTTLFANYLSYIKGKKIVVVDTDKLHYTIYSNRSEDKQLLDNSDSIRATFDSQPSPLLYPVLRCNIGDLHQFLVEQVLSLQDDYDYILVDTKGDLSEESVTSISIFNTVFIPTEVSDSSSKSASFTGQIMQNLISAEHEDIELKNYYFIWSRSVYSSKTASEKQELIDTDFSLDFFANRFLKNELPHKMAIQKRNISNTILFPTQDILDSQVPELLPLLEEMYEIIEVQKKKLSGK